MAVSRDNLLSAGSPEPNAVTSNGHDVLRHVADLEATLPPTPVRELLAASGATLFVLATDADFVAAIKRAAAERYPLSVVETWSELESAAESGRCGIALLDAGLLGARVDECVATLAAHADRVVTLVATDRATAPDYLGLVSNGRVHRLLIKPVHTGATRLLIESATARRLQLREAAAEGDLAQGLVLAPSRFPNWAGAVSAAVAALALLGIAIAGTRLEWWNWPPGAETVAPAVTEAAAPEATPAPVDELTARRAQAALAHQEGRLADPVGDSALDHYLAILALAPADQAARNGVSSVVEVLFTQAEEALLADSLEPAAATLDRIRRADPASSRLAFLDAQLARALAALAVPVSASPAAVSTLTEPTELESAIGLATARLRRGQLLTPAGDSARAYLDRAAELGPDDPRVAALRTDLAAALVAAARLVANSDVAAATNLAAEARRQGFSSPALVALEREIAAARALQEQQFTERLGVALERVQNGALFEPPNDSAIDRLSRLQADAPGLAGLAEAWEAFRAAVAVAVQRYIQAREWAAADAALTRLSQVPGGAEATAPLAAELAAGRLQQTYLATAVPASELMLVSSAPAVYPAEAVDRELEGWVDLEFVVDTSGQPRDLTVVQASRPNTFNAAALAAVERYRYTPFELNGRIYERRLRFRVRFQLE